MQETPEKQKCRVRDSGGSSSFNFAPLRGGFQTLLDKPRRAWQSQVWVLTSLGLWGQGTLSHQPLSKNDSTKLIKKILFGSLGFVVFVVVGQEQDGGEGKSELGFHSLFSQLCCYAVSSGDLLCSRLPQKASSKVPVKWKCLQPRLFLFLCYRAAQHQPHHSSASRVHTSGLVVDKLV